MYIALVIPKRCCNRNLLASPKALAMMHSDSGINSTTLFITLTVVCANRREEEGGVDEGGRETERE